MNRITNSRRATSYFAGMLIALALSSCAYQPSKPAAAIIIPPSQPVAVVPVKQAPAPVPVQVSAPIPKTASAKMLPAVKLWGTVKSVNLTERELLVTDKHGRTRTISVAADASLTKGGNNKTIGIADIKAGDYVTLQVSGDIARRVHVNLQAVK